MRNLPDGEYGASERDRAKEAGIDATVLNRLLDPMDPAERATIRVMCARDLDATRRATNEAVRHGDVEALARHLHVMSSLAQTIGANALAHATGSLQDRVRAGATGGYGDIVRRMDHLAGRAADFLAEGEG